MGTLLASTKQIILVAESVEYRRVVYFLCLCDINGFSAHPRV